MIFMKRLRPAVSWSEEILRELDSIFSKQATTSNFYSMMVIWRGFKGVYSDDTRLIDVIYLLDETSRVSLPQPSATSLKTPTYCRIPTASSQHLTPYPQGLSML
mmetsp:Transcript_20738/g.35389  ORF Transcript_20738/g.35389 Transcript_20738/m.35389 type:complete len:104 (+) Transcript_20738:105-416(+)